MYVLERKEEGAGVVVLKFIRKRECMLVNVIIRQKVGDTYAFLKFMSQSLESLIGD